MSAWWWGGTRMPGGTRRHPPPPASPTRARPAGRIPAGMRCCPGDARLLPGRIWPREQVRSVTNPRKLLQPPRGQSRSCRRSGRVLKWVLLLNTRDVPTAPWQAAHRVPPAHRCAPGSTGLEIPLVSRVGNQTDPGTALGTAKRSAGGDGAGVLP